MLLESCFYVIAFSYYYIKYIHKQYLSHNIKLSELIYL